MTIKNLAITASCLSCLIFAAVVAHAQLSSSNQIDYQFDNKNNLVKTVTTTEIVNPTDVNFPIFQATLEIKDLLNQQETVQIELDKVTAKLLDAEDRQADLIKQRQEIINHLPSDQQKNFPAATTTIP